MQFFERVITTAVMAILGVSILLFMAVLFTQGAAAQEQNQSAEDRTEEIDGEQIDQWTYVLSSEWNDEAGTVSVTIRSERLQEVTVTDAGAFIEGGEIPQRSVTLEENETSTIVIPATKTERGFVGVSVATPETLYAIPIETQEDTNPFAKTSSTAGWLGGASVVGIMAVLSAWRELRRQPTEPVEVVE